MTLKSWLKLILNNLGSFFFTYNNIFVKFFDRLNKTSNQVKFKWCLVNQFNNLMLLNNLIKYIKYIKHVW